MTAENQSGRSLALEVLIEVERKKAFSNLELNAALKRSNVDRREAGLATELVYGTLSRLNTLDWLANQLLTKPIHKLEPWLRNLLRLSLYQLKYLDKIPDRAVVHEAVEEAKRYGHKGTVGLLNGVLRNFQRRRDELHIPAAWPKFKKIAIEHSHPEWLVKRWLGIYGEKETAEMCQMNNHPPTISLRTNRLKGTRGELIQRLEGELPEARMEPSQVTEEGISISHAGNPALSQAFQQGWCTIQDESSMLVAYALAPKAGMAVLDTCAAPGGKTTHIAEKMQNQGRILALDIHDHKLKLIEENAARLGIDIIETKQADARELPTNLANELFDRVLVDAPCTGFGVIRRKPDLKWQKSEKDVEVIGAIQQQILEQASQWIKSDGYLVYSTCTVEPEENGRLVHRFIDENPEFILDSSLINDMPVELHGYFHKSGSYIQILPQYLGSDGFFIARLKRKG